VTWAVERLISKRDELERDELVGASGELHKKSKDPILSTKIFVLRHFYIPANGALYSHIQSSVFLQAELYIPAKKPKMGALKAG